MQNPAGFSGGALPCLGAHLLIEPDQEFVARSDHSLPDPERGKIFPMQKCVGIAAGDVEIGRNVVGIQGQGELLKRGVEFSYFFHVCLDQKKGSIHETGRLDPANTSFPGG